MPTKVTMYMSCNNYTWSEAHYYMPGNSPQDTDQPALQLANARSLLLGRGASINVVRISTVPANRIVFDIDTGGGVETGNWPADPTGASYNADRPWNSLMVRMESGAGSKNLYLAGIPDIVIQTELDNDEGYNLVPAFAGPFDAYMQFLLSTSGGSFGAPWGYRTRNRAGAVQAQAVVTNALFPQTVGIVTPTAVGVAVGDEVYATGWRRQNTRLPGLSGAWQVSGIIPPAAGPGPFTYFLNGSGGVPTDNWLGFGQLGPLTYTYISYNGHQVRKSAKRARGGSFGLPRGRSRIRR